MTKTEAIQRLSLDNANLRCEIDDLKAAATVLLQAIKYGDTPAVAAAMYQLEELI